MRFAEACGGWQERRLTQEAAARLPGVCERTFRRYVDRYEDEGLDGLVDKLRGQVSARRAPVDEVVRTAVSPNTGTSPTVGATHASPLPRRSGTGLNYLSAAQTPGRSPGGVGAALGRRSGGVGAGPRKVGEGAASC